MHNGSDHTVVTSSNHDGDDNGCWQYWMSCWMVDTTIEDWLYYCLIGLMSEWVSEWWTVFIMTLGWWRHMMNGKTRRDELLKQTVLYWTAAVHWIPTMHISPSFCIMCHVLEENCWIGEQCVLHQYNSQPIPLVVCMLLQPQFVLQQVHNANILTLFCCCCSSSTENIRSKGAIFCIDYMQMQLSQYLYAKKC